MSRLPRCFSFFLSWVSNLKTQPNHWTKRMASTPLASRTQKPVPDRRTGALPSSWQTQAAIPSKWAKRRDRSLCWWAGMYFRANQSPQSISLTKKKRSAQGSMLLSFFLSFRRPSLITGFMLFFLVWNPQASAPITSGTHTDGGAVIRKHLARRYSRNHQWTME